MKTPLRYQVTDYDCGKTSFINALMYQFERSEIPPQAVDFVARVTGDCNLCINGTMRGTSAHSLAFVGKWCNDYLVQAGLPIRCQELSGDEVSMEDGSPLVEGLKSGAVAVCGCRLRVDHYVLVVGLQGDDVLIFDPYYDTWPPTHVVMPDSGVAWVDDCPFTHNRVVSRALMNDPDAKAYSLYAKSGRDAVLVWRTDVDEAESQA